MNGLYQGKYVYLTEHNRKLLQLMSKLSSTPVKDLVNKALSELLTTDINDNLDLNLDYTDLITSRNVQICKDAVCIGNHLSIEHILSPSRKRNIVDARRMLLYAIKTNTSLFYREIAEACTFNNGKVLDHATVVHAVNSHGHIYKSDPTYKEKWDVAEQIIRDEINLSRSKIKKIKHDE